MAAPYTVIDAATDGVYGPFNTFREARDCATKFPRYEILNAAGNLVDWSGPLPRPAASERVANPLPGTGARRGP